MNVLTFVFTLVLVVQKTLIKPSLWEHKSKRTEATEKETIVQVGEYIGEILEAQPFGHHMPAFTLLRDHIRIWMFDCLGFT